MDRTHNSLKTVLITGAIVASPLQAQDNPDELVLDEAAIIDITINEMPLRFKVDPGLTGPPAINPEIARQLFTKAEGRLNHDFGGLQLQGLTTRATFNFGGKERYKRLAWTTNTLSDEYDGVIGVHDLPHRRVTFTLKEPAETESVQTFKLRIVEARTYPRLGTYVDIADKRMFMIFAPHIGPNVTTAGTANFIATHQEGGFVEGSDGEVLMNLGVTRPTRDMRLALPIIMGDLDIASFAVRIDDHGVAEKVGAFDTNRAKNSAKNIIVKRRKGSGRADFLSRIGRDQIAHCSRLSFDMKKMQAELSCAPI